MTNPHRLGSALSALAIASILAGCAAPNAARTTSSFGGAYDKSNVGLATRAAAALAAEDYLKAVALLERAVENSPRDAGFRALLGNSYFGAGRFASAEAAYRDSLTLLSNQPQLVLKLALVQIAQGKPGDALAFLEAARPVLDASDYGLAVALAGEPAQAIAVLEPSARAPGADAQVRQNLALAYALAGDWAAARAVAAQDLSPELVDSRIQQWMAFAKPARASDQVAALTGIRPAAADPGQPVRLALRDNGTRQAAVQPVQRKAPVVAQAAPAAALGAAPAVVQPFSPVPEYVAPLKPVAAAPAPAPEPVQVAEAPANIAPPPPPVRRSAVRAAAFVPAKRAPVRQASLVRSQGRSTAVVQLGAYGTADRVAAAWNNAARRFTSLRAYTPMSARFSGPRGTVYRLSVKGFASAREATSLCASLRRSGGSCFVRTVAGDTPVRIASR